MSTIKDANPSTSASSGLFSGRVVDKVSRSSHRIAEYHKALGESRSTNLLGYVMELGYDNAVIVTNDFYKIRAGGISKNSFLLIRPESLKDMIAPEDLATTSIPVNQPPHLILIRVREPAPTPLAQDVARTYFEMHKSHMPELDVFTKAELQWGAIKGTVLGTFFDFDGRLRFGGDIESFLSPHMYTVHVPTREMLETLVNYLVDDEGRNPQEIGWIRLTESLLNPPPKNTRVPVRVSPRDFVGTRTALFGKTRMGKSNTVKIIARMIMDSDAKVGQVIFDLNGEYAYRNEQDQTSLYEEYAAKCERYTLRPNPGENVKPLKANFYKDLKLGHQILTDLFKEQQGRPPDYLKPFFEWQPLDEDELEAQKRDDRSAYQHYRRHQSIYECILRRAGFDTGNVHHVDFDLKKEVRVAVAGPAPALGQLEGNEQAVPRRLTLEHGADAWTALWSIYDPSQPPFATRTGRNYLDETAEAMLTVLTGRMARGGATRSGFKKFVPYRRYHSPIAGDLLSGIKDAVSSGKTVIVDLSNAPSELARFFSELISRGIFNAQMDRFTTNSLADSYVQFYFEEAHNLFPRDDRDLTTIYNRLAKEGAKLNIGLIYSTQSIESLSPDLLKNTENFFIAHLNDEREIKALTRFQEFRDVGADVQRTKAKGFVRMITQSHKFALPAQIHKFESKTAKGTA